MVLFLTVWSSGSGGFELFACSSLGCVPIDSMSDGKGVVKMLTELPNDEEGYFYCCMRSFRTLDLISR